MPRPIIRRSVKELPPYNRFGPLDHGIDSEIVMMSIDEYETIRLIDELSHTQEECSLEMGIGRTTAQRIYNSARHKIALCLVYGKTLQIEGGDYFIKGFGPGRGRGGNRGHGHGQVGKGR